ncbi:hypothetical protein [Metapseudomonas furukawaii]|uniref:Uncharacterized protein n=1 Tax=Metapseudomonas furukawaii TaxID=1149133 RepID=A0AAD1FHD4_METFU|nr:hypothetical protein [Pseudomonas furukawaii]ELS25659.1 hypothetical protein ppKF707_0755 [Pseudomonas furukawaii]BAU76152.1 hypothetical protein KF707C_44640 [Pseudomonas furukawaii]
MSQHRPTAVDHAVGVLKLVGLHIDHPTVIDQKLVRDASAEAIERLQQQIAPAAHHLALLYARLIERTPQGYRPYVTLTQDPQRPYGAVITDTNDNVVARQLGKSVDSLVELLAAQLPRKGRGEVHG